MITSKAKLEQKCREILHGTPLFEFVNEEWSKFLIEEVFPNHPDWEAKVGIGIDHLEVRPDKFRGRCFYIIRRNGSFTDISFKAAIYPPNKKADVKSACRSAIQPMIARIRSAIRVPFKCPITGEDVIDKRDAHIDHYDLTFNEVFNEWIKGKDIDALYERTLMRYTKGHGGQTRTMIPLHTLMTKIFARTSSNFITNTLTCGWYQRRRTSLP